MQRTLRDITAIIRDVHYEIFELLTVQYVDVNQDRGMSGQRAAVHATIALRSFGNDQSAHSGDTTRLPANTQIDRLNSHQFSAP